MFENSADLFPSEDKKKRKRNNYFLRAKRAINKNWQGPEQYSPKSHKYSPSSLANLCPRERVFQAFIPRTGPSDGISATLRMDVGNFAHRFLQNRVMGPLGLLKGYWEARNDLFQEEDNVFGYMPRPDCFFKEEKISNRTLLDGYLAFTNAKIDGRIGEKRYEWLLDGMKGDPPEDDGVDFIWDFKFTSDRNYQSIRETEDLKYYYKLQQDVYQLIYDCPKTIFMFFNFSDWDYKFVEYESEQKSLENALATIKEVEDGIIAKELPPTFVCDSEKDTRAKGCPYSKECFSGKPLREILDENAT